MPPQYLHVWNHYHDVEQQRKAQEKAKEDSKQPIKRLEREIQSIVMSQENQELLQEALLTLHPPESTQTQDIEPRFHSISRYLIKEGFPVLSVETAIQEMSKTQPSNLMEALLDWFCFHLDDTELPAAYSKRSKTQIVNIMNLSLNQMEDEVFEDDEVTLPEVQHLTQLGYSKEDSLQALEDTNFDIPNALIVLFKQLTGIEVEIEQIEGEFESWTEECQVLSAIYDEHFSELNSTSIRLILQLPSELLNSTSSVIWKLEGRDRSSELGLELWNIGNQYPMTVPLISISCRGLQSLFLQYLTLKLSQKSVELVGSPMVHELVDALLEFMNEALDPGFQLSKNSNPAILPTPQMLNIPQKHQSFQPASRRQHKGKILWVLFTE